MQVEEDEVRAPLAHEREPARPVRRVHELESDFHRELDLTGIADAGTQEPVEIEQGR